MVQIHPSVPIVSVSWQHRDLCRGSMKGSAKLQFEGFQRMRIVRSAPQKSVDDQRDCRYRASSVPSDDPVDLALFPR